MTDHILSNQQASQYGKEPESSFQQIEPSSKYPHLEALPMFPLESEKAEEMRRKMLAFAAQDRGCIKEIPKLTTTEQIGKAVISATGTLSSFQDRSHLGNEPTAEFHRSLEPEK